MGRAGCVVVSLAVLFLSVGASPTASGQDKTIVLEDVSAKCGIQRQKAPMVKDGQPDFEKMEAGKDYYDWPFDVFSGDIDGDGHMDLFSADHHANRDSRTPGGIWLGKGDGTFGRNILLRVPIEGAKALRGLGVGIGYGTVLDVDGDGKMDFICSDNGYYRDEGVEGQGDERAVKFTRYAFGGARGWTFNDFNRDGKLDVAVGWGSTLYFGGGKGTYPTSGWKVSAQIADVLKPWEDPFHHCISADLRRTGAADILCGQTIWRWSWDQSKWEEKRANAKPPRGILLVNDGKGNFTESAEAYGLAEMSSTGPLVAADFNNDGYFDLFVAGQGNPDKPAKARVYINEGGKKFAMKDAPDLGIGIKLDAAGGHMQYSCASAADMNNDGLIDLVVDHAGRTRIFINLGGFKFEEVKGFGAGARPALADFNEDGLLDLACVGGPSGVQVFLNRTRTASGWLEVKVKGTEGNVCGIGALIEVFKTGKLGDRTAYVGMQHVVAENQNHVPLVPHFGLGQEPAVDVRVTLPTGEVLETRGVKARTRLVADFAGGKTAEKK